MQDKAPAPKALGAITSTGKARRNTEEIPIPLGWGQNRRLIGIMTSPNNRNHGTMEKTAGVKQPKQKFPVYFTHEEMELIEMLYQRNDCRSKTEFVEHAVRFYCGYLMASDPATTDFLAPQLRQMTEGIVTGSEQKISRALFKVAVELAAISHMTAAVSDLNEQTMSRLRALCTEEVRESNGILNFEKAVRFQHSK